MPLSPENQVVLKKQRVSYKRSEVVCDLRKKIIDGKFKSGERLPSRAKLSEILDVAPLTLQDAMNELISDGWIVSRHRMATHVVQKPPHLNRFALLLIEPDESHRTFREKALIEAARIISKKNGWQIEPQFVLENNIEETQTQIEFPEMVKREYYGGMIVAAVTRWADAYLPKLRLPNVIIGGTPKNIPCFSKSHLLTPAENFFDEDMTALDYLKRRGCHRIGFFGTTNCWEQDKADEFRKKAESFGMVCLPGFYQNTTHNVDKYQFSGELMDMMFQAGNPLRPDGLIVKNEGVLPPLQKTLHKFYGDKAFDAVKIVSIGNLPVLPETDLDVRFFGYDMTATLENAVRSLIQYRQTGTYTPLPEVLFNRLNLNIKNNHQENSK